ncbi:ABC transporter ATP-binding protein [Rhodococcus rhodnii]|nr:ABC transporter ATP-binding protein [Rhodococcus rhodnii]TXG89985.1 ABC transporter ATP-binding protein [Rhodococcus rhodnii]
MHAIDVREMTKRYGSRIAVDSVSLTVGAGEIVGLLGGNGAGKTTTVETIAGLRTADSGQVRVTGLDPVAERGRVRTVLGVQLQNAAFHYSLTARELLHLYSRFYPDPVPVDDLLGTLGLTDVAGTRFENLSGGQMQRLSIAVALVGRPRVVLLDELSTGLDPAARRMIWGTVRGLRDDGVAVLLVSHLMEEVETLCDRLVLLEHGRVREQGTVDEVIARAGIGEEIEFRGAGGELHSRRATLDDAFVALSGERRTDSTEGQEQR